MGYISHPIQLICIKVTGICVLKGLSIVISAFRLMIRVTIYGKSGKHTSVIYILVVFQPMKWKDDANCLDFPPVYIVDKIIEYNRDFILSTHNI